MIRALFASFLFCSTVVGTFGQTSSGNVSERIQFSQGTDGELRIQVNAGESFTLSQLRKAENAFSRDGIEFRPDGDALSIIASRRPLVFEVAEFRGLRGEIPPQGAVNLRISPTDGMLRATTPASNKAAAILEFVDGARAELPASATARAEFLRDGTYFLSGSTNVTARTAEGVVVKFSRHSGLMIGGELRETLDARGTKRIARATPVSRFDLSGGPDGTIEIKGVSPTTLIDGQDKLFSFENGTRIFLRQDRAKGTLQWRVSRGALQLTVGGFSCWKAVATSGQSGSLQWNPAKRVVDLKLDADSEEMLAVQLSARVSASIAPGALFQYAQFQDCGSFSTAAIGDVVLYDRETGESLPVQQASVSYNEGSRISGNPAGVGGPYNRVSLLWDTDSRIQLRGSAVSYPVSAGTEQRVRFGNDEMAANFGTDGALVTRAMQGNFTLLTAFIPDLAIDIPEGGALVSRLNRQRGLFMAQATEDSGASLRVTAAGQTYMYLSGAARIVVVLGQNSIIPEGAASWIFFEGAGGESTFTSGPRPGTVITPTTLDASRVFQEPVSIIE